MILSRRKSFAAADLVSDHGLKRTLGWPHLIAMGIGAIIGTGIYTLTGISAGLAGPAVMLSFMIAGAICAAAALCYAEMAAMIPVAGSAYTYTYSVLGEVPAWVVGWSLILEYTVVCSAVAVGWAGYAVGALKGLGVELPTALISGPFSGGIVNLPGVVVCLLVAGLLILGTRESARVNFVLVVIKLIALAAFVGLALPAFNSAHFQPFMPYGFSAHAGPDGVKMGVMGAAALIFFAFYGFDALSTAAEETKNPTRDLTIGIVGSLVACTLIYMVVAAAAIGASPISAFSASSEPLAFIMRSLGHPAVALWVAGAAVIALPSVIMVFMFGQSRVFLAMARDRLLPEKLAGISPKTGVPVAVTLATGVLSAIVAGLFPLKEIAELANAGTLCAFFAVALCVLVLRITQPALERKFRAPGGPVAAVLAMAGSLYLFINLPNITVTRFFVWNAIGIAVYFLYARKRSRMA